MPSYSGKVKDQHQVNISQVYKLNYSQLHYCDCLQFIASLHGSVCQWVAIWHLRTMTPKENSI